MAKYTEVEKYEIVRLFYALKKEGSVDIKGVEVQNIRAFCKELNVSSQSIYRWDEKFLSEIETELTLLDYKPCNNRHWCKAHQQVSDFDKNCNVRYDCSEFIIDDDVDDPHDYPAETYEVFGKEPKIEFGTRFWQFVAKNMGIKNYAMNLKQLKIKIGLELINGTGLVDSTKVRKELRL